MTRQVRCECGYTARGRSDDEVISLIRTHVAVSTRTGRARDRPTTSGTGSSWCRTEDRIRFRRWSAGEARASEQRDVDIVACEDRSGRRHGVAPDQEVLGHRVDVAQAALQRGGPVDGRATAAPIGLAATAAARSVTHTAVARTSGALRERTAQPSIAAVPHRPVQLVQQSSGGPQLGVGRGQLELEQVGSAASGARRAAAPCRWPARRCRRARPARCRPPRWRSRARTARAPGCGRSAYRARLVDERADVGSAGNQTSSTAEVVAAGPAAGPTTFQVSSISTWSGENTAIRSRGCRPRCPRCSCRRATSACWQPLAKPHRPVTR